MISLIFYLSFKEEFSFFIFEDEQPFFHLIFFVQLKEWSNGRIDKGDWNLKTIKIHQASHNKRYLIFILKITFFFKKKAN